LHLIDLGSTMLERVPWATLCWHLRSMAVSRCGWCNANETKAAPLCTLEASAQGWALNVALRDTCSCIHLPAHCLRPVIQALKEPEDAAERAAAEQLAHLPSDADLGVLLPKAPAAAGAAGGGAAAGEGAGAAEDGGAGLGPEAEAALEQFQELYKDVGVGGRLGPLLGFSPF
jgi:hypothetical protein